MNNNYLFVHHNWYANDSIMTKCYLIIDFAYKTFFNFIYANVFIANYITCDYLCLPIISCDYRLRLLVIITWIQQWLLQVLIRNTIAWWIWSTKFIINFLHLVFDQIKVFNNIIDLHYSLYIITITINYNNY